MVAPAEGAYWWTMETGLSKSDLKRIETFANTPMHQRSPEMLLPEFEEE